MRAVSPSTDPCPGAQGQQAPNAARAEAANPVTDDHSPGDEDGDGATFRRREL